MAKAKKKTEMVTIMIPHPKESVGDAETTVSVNGKIYQIQYDKQITVPKNVADIIYQSMKQRDKIQKAVEAATYKSGKASIAEL